MPLWIALHLPCLDLDTHSPNWRTEPVAILAEGIVQACSPLARQAGVRPGMRAQGVHALCRDTRLLPLVPERRQQGWQAVIQRMRAYTPTLTDDGEDTLLLDIEASLSLFGGIRSLCQQIQRAMADCRLPGGGRIYVTLAVAPTAAGAGVLARCRHTTQRRALQRARLARLLDTLPCDCLPAARPHLDWLHGIGCNQLGALRQLPRTGLQRRTRTLLLQAVDALYGLHEAPQPRLPEAPAFQAHCELAFPVTQAMALDEAANTLLIRLSQWMRERHLACTRMRLFLRHESGRRARAPTLVCIRPGAPAWEAGPLRSLLAEHLRHVVLPAPVLALSLRVRDLEPRTDPGVQGLFPEPGGTPALRRQVLDMLQARLGRNGVLRPAVVADHRPEVANRWIPLDDVAQAPTSQPPDGERPCWLLTQPLPLKVRQHRPCLDTPLRLIRGPERIEDGWWQQLVARDYYVAQDAMGRRYWLFQERGPAAGWFLHGLFG